MDTQEESVNVINPAGKLVSIPKSQSQTALAQYGYKPASDQDILDYQQQQTYGTGAGNAIKAFGLGAAGGATFNIAPYLMASEIAPGVPAVISSEKQKALQKYQPEAYTAGEVTGIGGSLLVAPEADAAKIAYDALKAAQATGDAAQIAKAAADLAAAKTTLAGLDVVNPVSAVSKIGGKAANLLSTPENASIAAKILNQSGSYALGSAVEGSIYGLGQTIHEAILGDPDVNAERLISNVGLSALLSGAMGGAVGGLSGSYAGIKNKFFDKEIQKAALRDSISEVAAPGPPGSLEDMRQKLASAQYMGLSTDLPGKELLHDAAIKVPDMELPVTKLQLESLVDQNIRDKYKAIKESDNFAGKTIRDYEILQKQEALAKTKTTIESLGENLTSDPVKAGNDLIKGFSKQYKDEKESLGPFFKDFDKTRLNSITEPGKILTSLEGAIPGTSDVLKIENGKYSMFPYRASLPVSRETYNAMKDVVDGLNEKVTIGGLRNIREAVSDRIDWMKPREAMQLSSLKKGLMDVIQDNVQALNPSMEVREAFKKYAINEANREVLERIMGGSISAKSFGKTIKPEDVISRIFGNTISVKAAKEILGHNEFNKVVGNYLSHNMEKVTDAATNGFSSKRFNSFLKGKSPELNEAFKDNQDRLSRIHALTDIMRILPDSGPLNPSGTATKLSLLEKMKHISHYLSKEGLASVPGNALKFLSDKMGEAKQAREIDEVLAGQYENKAKKYTILSNMEKMAQKTSQDISGKAKKLFNFREPLTGYIGAKIVHETHDERAVKHQQVADNINHLNNNPEYFVDKLHEVTDSFFHAAPQISSALQQTAIRATQFLASKVPTGPSSLLSPAYVPSNSEIAQFDRYHRVVQKPLEVMTRLKVGDLTPEDMDGLTSVYPKLYQQMRVEVQDKMTDFLSKHDSNEIPYRTKLALSQFLNEDLVDSLNQQQIASTQMIMAGGGQQQAANEVANTVKGSQKGLDNLKIAESSMTDIQKSAQREGV